MQQESNRTRRAYTGIAGADQKIDSEVKILNEPMPTELKQEILLLINQRLFEKGLLSKAVYEQAKVEIVNRT